MRAFGFALTLTAFAFIPVSALAETGTSGKTRTVTEIVGYKEKTVGNIILLGESSDPGSVQRGKIPTHQEAFGLLDTNNDGALSKTEFYAQPAQAQPASTRGTSSNIKTREGRPARVDYYARSTANSQKSVLIEDLTEDGTFFEIMDKDSSGSVSQDEFQVYIKQDINPEAIQPAAGTRRPASYND